MWKICTCKTLQKRNSGGARSQVWEFWCRRCSRVSVGLPAGARDWQVAARAPVDRWQRRRNHSQWDRLPAGVSEAASSFSPEETPWISEAVSLPGRRFYTCQVVEAGDRGGLRIICDDFGGVGLIGGVDLTSGVSSLISTDSIFSSWSVPFCSKWWLVTLHQIIIGYYLYELVQ